VQSFGRLHIIWRGWHGFLLLGLLFFLLLRIKNRQTKMNTINDIGKDIYLRLIESGFNVTQAQYITAQAAHETANFTSKIFTENNNLFGYKFVGQQIAQGSKNGHAYYENIADSIQDYKNYYNRRGYPAIFANISEFVKALKRNNYFEASETEYLNGVKHFYNLYFA
jgi:uncharacterized FlgJ-related protein